MVKIKNLDKGINLCLRNAERLIEDAELLFEHRSYGHATSLICLSIEELAKALRCSGAYFFNEEYEQAKDVFLNHKTKLSIFEGVIVSILLQHGRSEKVDTIHPKKELTLKDIQKFIMDFEPLFKRQIREADKLRKAGFYVDYKNGKWYSPDDIQREKAKGLVDFSKLCLTKMEFLCKTLIIFAPLRHQCICLLLVDLKKALDEGRISQGLYDVVSSGLEEMKSRWSS